MNQNLSEAAMNWEKIDFYQTFWFHETTLVAAHPDEEVDHEEDVETKVDLLSCVLKPRNTGLHIVTADVAISIWIFIFSTQSNLLGDIFHPWL